MSGDLAELRGRLLLLQKECQSIGQLHALMRCPSPGRMMDPLPMLSLCSSAPSNR